jgi:hypothetical protein
MSNPLEAAARIARKEQLREFFEKVRPEIVSPDHIAFSTITLPNGAIQPAMILAGIDRQTGAITNGVTITIPPETLMVLIKDWQGLLRSMGVDVVDCSGVSCSEFHHFDTKELLEAAMKPPAPKPFVPNTTPWKASK